MSTIQGHSHSKAKNFTILSNEIFDDRRLQMDEAFFLMWLHRNKDGFGINSRALCTHFNISTNKLSRITKNLQALHLLVIHRTHDGKTTWHYFDTSEEGQEYKQMLCTKPRSQNEIKPRSQKPNSHNEITLISTDLLTSTKERSSADDQQKSGKQEKAAEAERKRTIERGFDYWWKVYPRKIGRKPSLAKWKVLCRKLTEDQVIELTNVIHDDIVNRIESLSKGETVYFGFDGLHPQTYINQERWNDERMVTA